MTTTDHTAENNRSYTVAAELKATGSSTVRALRPLRAYKVDADGNYTHTTIARGTALTGVRVSNAGFRGQEFWVKHNGWTVSSTLGAVEAVR